MEQTQITPKTMTVIKTNGVPNSKYDNVKVIVRYSNGNNADIVTIGEIKKRLKDENKNWLSRFFANLLIEGHVSSRFNREYYKLV